jgi:Fusaric acid resistance protein-like
MTQVATPPAETAPRSWTAPFRWYRSKDPNLLALKRSTRAAVVMPAVFALAHFGFSNSQVGLFAAFGSFALLLLVEFTGRPRTRLAGYLALFATGCAFIALGTLASTHEVAAVASMAVVGFAVLYAGIVTPLAATAATAALLVFVLPVAVAQPTSAIGPRLLGWLLAGVFCIPACFVLWPPPWHDDLRRKVSAALSAMARVADVRSAGGPVDPGDRSAVTSALAALRSQFRGTPYPPTGAVGSAVALTKLVGRVEWIASNATLVEEDLRSHDRHLDRVLADVGSTLRRSADLVCDASGHPVEDPVVAHRLQEAVERLRTSIAVQRAADLSVLLNPDFDPAEPDESGANGEQGASTVPYASTLDPGLHVRTLGIVTELVAEATLAAAGTETALDQTLDSVDSAPRTFWNRFSSGLSLHSVWCRNAIRGAAGLALAVAVVEVTNVSHGFWVVLGTLSVLRTSALGTGATALRAVGGTAVGFVVGSAIMVGLSDHTVLLWVLLPPAVLLAGAAPAVISFTAGQAGFTLVVVILFNIIDPTGWEVGLTRIEDVAIGCGVSVAVGLLFWPRGATAALGRALSAAFVANSGYLADAVDRLTMSARQMDTRPSQRVSHSAYLRLDDALRQYFAERGAKVVPLETAGRLFTGANRIRLAAFTLTSLEREPPARGQPELESVEVAGAVLRDSYSSSHRWYEEFAELLGGRRASLDPLPAHGRVLHDVLGRAFEDARTRNRSDRLRLLLQMLWADELLEGQREVQEDLSDSAELFLRQVSHPAFL